MRVGIIGAGLIGKKRAAALETDDTLVAVQDIQSERARELAGAHGAETVETWESVTTHPDIDAVIISTTHDALAAVARTAIRSGKSVLVEKPAGRNPMEVRPLVEEARRSGVTVRVGFNHRFHPAFLEVYDLIRSGVGGPLMYVRARYGHGGRVGYESEWRAKAELSGGGELIDQGVHLIDLSRWILGPLELGFGYASTFFWKMDVEDNGFLFLKSTEGPQVAHLHASCTEWKNLFEFEIFSQTVKFQITGLGRSYGVEELKVYRMKPEMGPPDLDVKTYPGEDTSWLTEWQHFKAAVRGEPALGATLEDAVAALEIVHQTYHLSGSQPSVRPSLSGVTSSTC